jgi:hypothetical protein
LPRGKREDAKGKLKLTDNALDSPQTAALMGNGVNSVEVPAFISR